MSEKKVIFITHLNMHDNSVGGFVYSRALYRLMSKLYSTDYYCLFPKSLSARKFRKILSFLRSTFSSYPAKAFYFLNRKRLLELRYILSTTHYNYLFVDHLETLLALKMMKVDSYLPSGIKVIYIAHNYESRLYYLLLKEYFRIPFIATILKKDIKKYFRWERSLWKQVNGILAISPEEARLYSRYNRNVDYIFPFFSYHPVSNFELNTKLNKRIRLGFFGNLSWRPNYIGLQYFLNKVFPKLPKHVYEFHIFGKGSLAYNRDNVIGHGYKTIEEIFKTIDVFVFPIPYGAGMNIKVAEVLYNRRPMIISRVAARGLEKILENEKAVIILPTISDFSRILLDISKVRQLCMERISKETSNLFSENFNRNKLIQFLERVNYDKGFISSYSLSVACQGRA